MSTTGATTGVASGATGSAAPAKKIPNDKKENITKHVQSNNVAATGEATGTDNVYVFYEFVYNSQVYHLDVNNISLCQTILGNHFLLFWGATFGA